MNKVFAAKLPDGNTGLSEGGDSQSLQTLALSRAPGTIPSTVNPPKPNLAQPEEPAAAVATTSSAPPATRVSRPPRLRLRKSDGFFSKPCSQGRHRRQRRREAGERAAAAAQAEGGGSQAAAICGAHCARSPRPSLWKPDRPRLNRR